MHRFRYDRLLKEIETVQNEMMCQIEEADVMWRNGGITNNIRHTVQQGALDNGTSRIEGALNTWKKQTGWEGDDRLYCEARLAYSSGCQ